MRFVIVTGMSGAGKSTALRMLEDMGYFCVDNLPIALLEKFGELAGTLGGDVRGVALGVDIRSGQALEELDCALEALKNSGISYKILYLDASDAVLVKRYKETRRSHPLAKDGRIDRGIALERKKLAFLKEKADYILDTSQLLTRELNQELDKIFMDNQDFKNLMISVLSFGFKYGIPQDCDLVFDVRFLPNPFYVEELKHKTGNDREVQDYVMGSELSGIFLDKLTDMLDFLIPNYVLEGKNQLVIGIGCTGGKHRSVTLANRLFERLSTRKEYGVRLEHRDIRK
ncbi:MAG TPA: RNase adapter RapZ [Candidatus Limivivens intestinipullorum]|mgnify:CR=1 FL=1|uniref:RNase adapter RapZ n=1 Tax=Candidatus Limivivens intestinipullorum TaxID=2840858 RepID=A0A9D1JKU4_9FIRM|nr:RNase adapter RapZ [Candidatus Limivivens intestinipullorum]